MPSDQSQAPMLNFLFFAGDEKTDSREMAASEASANDRLSQSRREIMQEYLTKNIQTLAEIFKTGFVAPVLQQCFACSNHISGSTAWFSAPGFIFRRCLDSGYRPVYPVFPEPYKEWFPARYPEGTAVPVREWVLHRASPASGEFRAVFPV
jgi:hypothetical protein